MHSARSEFLEPWADVSGEENGRDSSRNHPVSTARWVRVTASIDAYQIVQHRQAYAYQNPGKTINFVEHRAGRDATFSAPKSISLNARVGCDERIPDGWSGCDHCFDGIGTLHAGLNRQQRSRREDRAIRRREVCTRYRQAHLWLRPAAAPHASYGYYPLAR